jgi:hypothetical protein
MSIARAAAMPNSPSLTALAIPSEDRRAGIVPIIMIALLPGTARADAIARSGAVLWRAGDSISRSEDRGLSWHTVWSPEEDEEETACSSIATDGDRVAALCGERLLQSHDGVHFKESAARSNARRVVFRGGRAVTLTEDDRLRRDGEWVCRFDEGRAWIWNDRSKRWTELPDAAAYDLMDVIPDGAGGAWAWTRVGLVRLSPEPAESEPVGTSWAPRLDLYARHRNIDGFADTAIFGALSFPLERPPRMRSLRSSSRSATLHAEMRSRAARLRIAGSRMRGSKSRMRRLRAEELFAQAAAVIEAAP